VVDARWKNCDFLEDHFERRYRRERRPYLYNTSYRLVA
jgi:hypothetical protein